MSKIVIPATDVGNIKLVEGILTKLNDIRESYNYSLGDYIEELDSLISRYEEVRNKAYETAFNRVGIWKKLLFKYYKMCCLKETSYGKYEHTSYIYPYRVIDENNTLWVLEVEDDDLYKGGVFDHSIHIDRDYDYEITLEEITEEEFRNHADETNKRVIDYRLNKINNKSN